MTRKDYLAKRTALLAEAETLINEGKLEEYAAKEKEIQDLDAKFETIAKAHANMNALKGSVVAQEAREIVEEDNTVTNTPKPQDEKANYKAAWAKVMMGMALSGEEQTLFDNVNARFRVSNTGGSESTLQTAETHTVVIPETVSADIWKEAAELFPILNDVSMTFVPGDLTILQETKSGDDAAWYDEDTEVADSDFAIGELNLTGCELAKSIPISWKLRKMSIARFIPYITGLLAEKMGAALARGIVSGKGKPGTSDNFKPEPKGVITALAAEARTPQIIEYGDGGTGEKPVLSYDTMAQAMGKVRSFYKSGASIYAKSDVIWGKLALIKDLEGRPMFIPAVTEGGVGRMFGLPVKEDDSIPADAILIGNLRRGYAANVNENMTIYTDDHKKKRYTDYMAYSIVDGAPLTTKAFCLIQKEALVAV